MPGTNFRTSLWLAQILIEQTGRTDIAGIMVAVVALCVVPVFPTRRETRPAEGTDIRS
ncbi:MAG TPA: hypothetical protein VE891_06325 [Allosphingosinicella sp.]|nr:hypothetical protein [Allosphingosinicella sp.]